MNVPAAEAVDELARGYSFFLNYARIRSSATQIAVDPWVKRLFEDLLAEMRKQAREVPADAGFLDFLLPTGADRMREVQAALASAAVFVPLYSPKYFTNREALSDEATFRNRLASTAPPLPSEHEHILPILWAPLPGNAYRSAVAEASTFAGDIPEYTANGLSVLCRHRTFRAEYAEVLSRMAAHIVRVAERSELAATPTVSVVDAQRVRLWDTTPFRIAVIAPTNGDLPLPNGIGLTADYGVRPESWRPFADEYPIVMDVSAEAERINLPTDIVEFAAEEDPFHDCPGMLLIDPWILATARGKGIIASMTGTLPSWVTVAGIIDWDAAHFRPYGEQHLNRLAAMFPPGRLIRFTSVAGWRRELRDIVSRMRREFIQNGPSYPPAGPAGQPEPRPRLHQPGADIPTADDGESR